MNKSELIAAVAEKSGLKRKDAGAAVDTIVDVIKEQLAQGQEVSVIGFGTFTVKTRGARTGRNPRTGEPIPIGESKSPVFRPGKALKDSLA